MKPIQIALAVGCLVCANTVVSTQSTTAGAGSDTAQGRRARARVVKLRPAAETDFVAEEMWFVADGTGKQRVVMSGPLNLERTELFWAVDPTGAYRLLKLTGDHVGDANRIKRIYNRFGFDMAIDEIVHRLASKRSTTDERVRQIKDQRPARDYFQARLDQGDCIRSGPSDEPDGQWVSRCDGWGYADVETWEPARYWFNVNILNDTNIQSSWWSEIPGGFSSSSNGACWANAETFVNTHWSTTYCGSGHTSYDQGFDDSQTGQYVNSDFWYYVLGVSAQIYTSATAAVQFVNGTPNYGVQWYADAGYINQFEPLFLSGIFAGDAQNSCGWQCHPAPLTLSQCENQIDYHYWDYNICDCVAGASPIIIDLDRNQITLSGPQNGVVFDLMADNRPVKVSWTRAESNDAFLVLDRNHNGQIDSGAELFGNFTPQPLLKQKRAKAKKDGPNGFLALAVFDDPADGGNGDGQITDDDAVYADLRLWIDRNHDGISQPDELSTLEAHGVRAISLHYVVGKRTDEFGDLFRFKSYVTLDKDMVDRGSIERRAIDVFLTYLPLP